LSIFRTYYIIFFPEILLSKVLHYKTNFLNPSETFINRLIQNHRNYHPVALCYQKKSFTENLEIYQVPKKGFKKWINAAAFHTNLSLPFYDKILKKTNPDVIHAHFGYDAYKLTGLAKRNHIPLVVSFYGSDVSRLPLEFDWKRRYKKLARMARHFIAASNFMKSQLIDLGFPADRISVVRFGLDLDKFNYQENDVPPQKILMIGRLVEKKGFEYAIRAVSNLQNIQEEVEVNIYGDGPLMDKLKQLSKALLVKNSIQFHGFQPNDTIQSALENHTILICPSVTAADGDMEGLPNTVLEAMAKGTAVLATRHAAIPEVVVHNETGFLFDEKDVDGLTNLLSEILNGHYSLNAIRRNARSVIEECYNVSKMVQDTEKIYDRILLQASTN